MRQRITVWTSTGRRLLPVRSKRTRSGGDLNRMSNVGQAGRDTTTQEAVDASGDEIIERICITLGRAIADGALHPGVKILEEAIAEYFSVSRTAVRGALTALQRDHLVERKRNRGTFVAEPTAEEGRQLFDARRAIEEALVKRAVPLATSSDLDRLEALIRQEEHIHQSGDEGAKRSLSGDFHVQLALIANNEVLAEYLAKVIARLSLITTRFGNNPQDGCGAAYHRRILDAIRAKDIEGARREMEAHLAEMESRVSLEPDRGDKNSLHSILDRFSDRNEKR